jgi:hypothetical protein
MTMMDEKALARTLREQADGLMAEAGPGRGPRAPEPPSLSRDDVRKEAQRTVASCWAALAEELDP